MPEHVQELLQNRRLARRNRVDHARKAEAGLKADDLACCLDHREEEANGKTDGKPDQYLSEDSEEHR